MDNHKYWVDGTLLFLRYSYFSRDDSGNILQHNCEYMKAYKHRRSTRSALPAVPNQTGPH